MSLLESRKESKCTFFLIDLLNLPRFKINKNSMENYDNYESNPRLKKLG